jgi:hypothetical protein
LSKCSYVKDDSELKKLDTIFELLCANPEFVQYTSIVQY